MKSDEKKKVTDVTFNGAGYEECVSVLLGELVLLRSHSCLQRVLSGGLLRKHLPSLRQLEWNEASHYDWNGYYVHRLIHP